MAFADGRIDDWPPFRRLVWIQAIHAAGDALVAVSLAETLFFSVSIGEARDRVALYLLLTMTPFALLAPVVGPLLDRWRGSYRAALVIASAGRVLLAVVASTRTEDPALYPLAFGILVLSRAHSVGRSALVPEILPVGRTLVWANARLSIASLAGGSVAGAIGLGIHRLAGSSATLRLAAAAFVVTCFAGLGLPTVFRLRRHVPAVAVHLLLSPRLLAGGIATATSRAALGFLAFLIAFAIRREGYGLMGFALLALAAALGTLAGAALAPAMRRLVREPAILVGSLVAIGASAVAVSGGFSLARAVLLSGVIAVFTSTARLGFDALVQADAPEEVRGRTFARYETVFQVCWVAGAGFATAFPFGPSVGLRVAGLICVLGVVLAIRGVPPFAPLRTRLRRGNQR
ncbi:MAG: hypothetical protein WDA27_13980 [Actinomycetota bacterium]